MTSEYSDDVTRTLSKNLFHYDCQHSLLTFRNFADVTDDPTIADSTDFNLSGGDDATTPVIIFPNSYLVTDSCKVTYTPALNKDTPATVAIDVSDC